MLRPLPLALIRGALCLGLAACATQEGYPDLLPTRQMLAAPDLPAGTDSEFAIRQSAESRSTALRARAEALRGPVIEPALRHRMQDVAG